MNWTLDYNNMLRAIELVYTGRITGPDLRETTSKAIVLIKEHGNADALVDATEIELTASLFDLYDLPAHQYVVEGLNYRTRVAVVLPTLPKERKDVLFYETACVNRGWLVRSFPNRSDAIEWLTGTDSSNKPDAGDA